MTDLYLFNWPDDIGGAGTKVWHLIRLLRDDFRITVVPNEAARLATGKWPEILRGLGVEMRPLEALPPRLSGWAVSLCNGPFLREGVASDMKRRGLRIAWGSEMMWHHGAEQASVYGGLVDTVLYTGEAQREALLPGYTCHGALPEPRGVIVGNYIDPLLYPYAERPERRVPVAGRVSRADGAKFPDDFPLTLHIPGLKRLHVRVLGWSDEVAARWPWYDFATGQVTGPLPPGLKAPARSNRVTWDLLPPGAEDVVWFLNSLDFYLYDTGPDLSESWGRAVVEAILTGLPAVIPADRRHHLHALVPDGVARFHCATREDWTRAVRALADPATRQTMGRAAAAHAREVLCHAEEHRAAWRSALP